MNKEDKKGSGHNIDFKEKILSDTNKLTLFLILKSIYLDKYQGVSHEYSELFKYKILQDKKNLKSL